MERSSRISCLTLGPSRWLPAGEGEAPPTVGEVVVDLLLSVLAQPSSTLREMCKHVMRAFAEDVTEGVQLEYESTAFSPVIGECSNGLPQPSRHAV